MKKQYLILLLACLISCSLSVDVSGQSCTGKRYQSHYFSTNDFYPNVVYSIGIEDYVWDLNLIQDLNIMPAITNGFENPIDLSDIDLTMDIRLPPTSDTLSKRPVFIWAFPGGFISGSKDAEDMQALIDTFALRGYVTASIHYRIGADVTAQSSVERAVYRGSQDASAAIRFFKENANILKIDTNFIFFGGSSAGALAGLHTSFLDEDERAADLPSTYDIPNPLPILPPLAYDLGLLHSHQVTQITGITTSNINTSSGMVPANHSGKPKGLVSCWGAIGDLNWLDNRPGVPDVLIFHGTGDAIVYHDCQPPFSNLVGGIGGLIVNAPVTCGGDEMDDVLVANGIPTESYIEVGAPHEYWGTLNGDFDNDFLVGGIGALGYDPIHWPDLIQKISNFAYNCMKPALPVVNGNNSVCANDIHTYTVAATSGSIYCWTVSGGSIVSSNLDAPTIDIQWGNGGNGTINVREISCNVVESDLATYNVTIVPVNVPTGVSLTNLTVNSVDLSWSAGPAGVSYEIEYRPVGGTWIGMTSSSNSASLSGLNLCTDYEYRIKTVCSATSESAWTNIATFSTPPLSIQLKLLLEGVYNGSNMNNNLSGSIPATQPYMANPWNYNGTETASIMPSNAVDWIKIELLDAGYNLVDETTAFLRTDGVVMDVNGMVGVGFCNATAGSYYLLVRHRNHLDVVSASMVAFPNGNYDFTTGAAQALGPNQLKNVGGLFALHAGDYDGNGIISVEDYNDFIGQSASTGYTTADGNLDLNITTADFNTYRPNASIIGMPIVRY